MCSVLYWMLVVNSMLISALPPVVKIGVILNEELRGSSIELAFKYAVYKINKEKTLLPNTTLVYDVQYVQQQDSFRTIKKACTQVESGAVAIFGSSDPTTSAALGAMCEVLDIPHIEISSYRREPTQFSINLHPNRNLLDDAYIQLFNYLNWSNMAIIYEDYGVGDVNMCGVAVSGKNVYIRRVDSYHQYRDILLELRSQRIKHIVIDTNPIYIHKLFRAILQLQMNNADYHYLFTSFDMELMDLEDFYFNGVNMSGWRLINTTDLTTLDIISVMEKFHPIGTSIINNGNIQADAGLMYDAVMSMGRGLSSLPPSALPTNMSCESSTAWSHGLSLYNYISSVSTQGLTGSIQFREGQRTQFQLELVHLSGREGLSTVGTWSSSDGLVITDSTAYVSHKSANITLTVITKQEIPYVMIKEGWNLRGNDMFEGFCIDLLAKVADKVGFHYTLNLVSDNMYGARDPITGEWNGIVRELMDNKADLAVASMTINYAREDVIDFTKPFMNLGIGILYKVPTSQPTRLFSFLNPLAIEIWLYVLAAYILVSFTLFVMARFSPYEWCNVRSVCNNHHSKLLCNQFTISNSFWFIIGTFLRQGSGLNPKATSTRVVGSIWWFFTLIILSSYTANLAAFLTVERTVIPIQNAADLAAQSQITYGTLDGGSTMTFFRDSNIELYQRMWKHMSSNAGDSLVTSYEEGVKRVLVGDYAFLMESTMLDHRVQRDCNLTQLGGLLDSKGYGIATPKGSIWRDKISLAILELQEKGVIQILYDKWWKNTGDVCNREGKDSKANPLGVQNIGGVFVVLLCGLAVAILVAILEFCWNTKRTTDHTTHSLCSEMRQELRMALKSGSLSGTARSICCDTTHVPQTTSVYTDSHVELRELKWS